MAPDALRDFRGRDIDRLGNLILQDQHARSAELAPLPLQRVRRDVQIGPRNDDGAVVAIVPDDRRAHARAFCRVHQNRARVDPRRLQVLDEPCSKIVGADASDHRGPRARPRRHHGLVAALAAALLAPARTPARSRRVSEGCGEYTMMSRCRLPHTMTSKAGMDIGAPLPPLQVRRLALTADMVLARLCFRGLVALLRDAR